MKFRYSWKPIILMTLVVVIGIILYKIKEYQEQAFIKACYEACLTDIYNYMTQEDSRIYFGQYELIIGEQKTSLVTMFYNEYIINKIYIKTYLENLNWKEIIVNNKENIIAYVRNDYISYIQKQENIYIYDLLKNTPRYDLKERIFNTLQAAYESLSVKPQIDIEIINNLIWNMLDTVNWNLYITTLECQKETFSTLIEIFYDKVQHVCDMEDIRNKKRGIWAMWTTWAAENNDFLNKSYEVFFTSLLLQCMDIYMKNLKYTISQTPKRILLNENTFNTVMKGIRLILEYLKQL